jgi:hypothetical protein
LLHRFQQKTVSKSLTRSASASVPASRRVLEGNHAFGCLLGKVTVSAADAAQFNAS